MASAKSSRQHWRPPSPTVGWPTSRSHPWRESPSLADTGSHSSHPPLGRSSTRSSWARRRPVWPRSSGSTNPACTSPRLTAGSASSRWANRAGPSDHRSARRSTCRAASGAWSMTTRPRWSTPWARYPAGAATRSTSSSRTATRCTPTPDCRSPPRRSPSTPMAIGRAAIANRSWRSPPPAHWARSTSATMPSPGACPACSPGRSWLRSCSCSSGCSSDGATSRCWRRCWRWPMGCSSSSRGSP